MRVPDYLGFPLLIVFMDANSSENLILGGILILIGLNTCF